jgi:hypothetical protein
MHGQLRVLVAILSGLVAAICTPLALLSYFGDHNEVWATRFLWVALVAGLLFLACFLL